jgi:hypothetical protein
VGFVPAAHDDARLVPERDPCYLFQRDAAIHYLRADRSLG